MNDLIVVIALLALLLLGLVAALRVLQGAWRVLLLLVSSGLTLLTLALVFDIF